MSQQRTEYYSQHTKKSFQHIFIINTSYCQERFVRLETGAHCEINRCTFRCNALRDCIGLFFHRVSPKKHEHNITFYHNAELIIISCSFLYLSFFFLNQSIIMHLFLITNIRWSSFSAVTTNRFDILHFRIKCKEEMDWHKAMFHKCTWNIYGLRKSLNFSKYKNLYKCDACVHTVCITTVTPSWILHVRLNKSHRSHTVL